MSVLQETTISLQEAAGLFPGARPGRPLAFSTVWRWALKGIRAGDRIVRLEACRLGGRWITSREAIDRFSETLTQREPTSPPEVRSPAKRRQKAAAAVKELKSLGIG